MKLMRKSILALFASLASASVAAWEEPVSRQTREFIQAAGESDTFELMEAYSALAQSSDPRVLDFARAMIRDHAQTSRMLQDATISAGLSPPPIAVGASEASFLAALQSARGRDFDRLYWTQQVFAHNAAMAVEGAYAAHGDTPPVRQAAAAAVPIIQAHLALAEQMKAKMGGY